MAQSVPTEQLCSQEYANQSFQLSIAQLCFKAQFTTCSIRACRLTTAQQCFDNSAWIKDWQNSASAKPVADRTAFQRRAFQPTSSAATSDTACFATRALQESGATAAYTTTAAAPATTSYIASSQQTALATKSFSLIEPSSLISFQLHCAALPFATSLFAKSLVNKNFHLTKQKLRNPKSLTRESK